MRESISFRRRLSAIAVIIAQLATVGIFFPQAAHANPTVTLPATIQASTTFANVNTAGALSISGYSAGASVQVTVGVSHGFLKISTTTGLTAPTGYTSAQWTADNSTEIAFYGTQANVSAALNSLQYRTTITNASATISVTSFVAGAAFNSTTGHFYEIVDNVSAINWEDARCKAKWGASSSFTGTVITSQRTAGVTNYSSYSNDRCSNTTSRRTMGGLRGYLANITSLEEQQFILGKLTGTGWIGGSDIDSEGTYVWMDGPETGQVFWTPSLGTAGSRRGSFTVSGSVSGFSYGNSRFNYFSDGEPNDASGEHWVEFGFGSNGIGGSWNDCRNGCNRTRYVIEYGEDTDALSGASGSINVNPRVLPVASETDTALTLNGSQFLSALDESTFDFPTGTTFTLEAWVRPSVSNQNQIIVGKNSQYSLLIHSSGSFGANFFTTNTPSGTGGESVIFGANSVRTNEWQHVALVRNGTTITGFINGQQAGSMSNASATDSIRTGSNPFVIGGYSNTDQPFTGQLDQVRVWSSARTASELQNNMHRFLPSSETSLVATYGFNEATGTRVFNNASSSTWNADLSINSSSVTLTPVAETSTVGAYSVVTFRRSILTAAGGWKAPETRTVTALVVGGGGGAGFNSGGGGSGGGISYQGALTVGGNLTVTVGMGGRGATSNGTAASGFSSVFGATTAAGGNGGVGPSGAGGASVAGSGAGGVGSTSTSTPGGNGGNGPSYSITGSSVNYAGGGGGGGWITNSLGGSGGAGGGGAGGGGGGSSRTGSNDGASGSANTGGGGGAGSVSSSTSGSGGSGIIIIRWITATAPTFTAPAAIDTTTALNRYTFRAGGSATTPLIRNYQWQYSSDTGTSWTTVQASTSDSYTTGLLDLGTSGPRYRYRVIVTDSDTAGLSISDSSTSHLVLNRYPTISPPTSNDAGLLVHLDASQAASYSGSGSTWNDLSGGGRNASLGISSGGPAVAGIVGSAATCSAPLYSNINGGSFVFDGNVTEPRKCAWISNTSFSSIGETYTVEMWVNPSSSSQPANSALISTPWSSNDKIYFAIAFNGTTTTPGVPDIWAGIFDGSNWYPTQITGIPVNSWSHVSLTSSNKQLTLYVNGEARQIRSFTAASTLSGTNKGVFIGRRWDGADTFNGSIGTVRISNTALTAEQIRQNYYLSSNRFSNSVSGVKSSSTTYAVTLTETFTATNGTGTKRFTFSPNNRAGIVWDTSTANSAVLRITNQLDAGTYYETMTATDSATAATTLALTITVDKARQASLSIGQYNAYPGVSTYPINVYGGSGSGAVTRSRLSAGSANCTLTSGMFLTATSPGTCSVQAVKAGDINYLSETATATIYWIQWRDAYATRAPSTPNEIVLNHQTAIAKYNYDTLTVTSYQNSSKATVTSIGRNQTLRIVGDGFSSEGYIEVLFANMASRYIPPANELNRFTEMQIVTESGINFLQFTVPTDADSGPITVNSPKGTAVGPSLTITP